MQGEIVFSDFTKSVLYLSVRKTTFISQYVTFLVQNIKGMSTKIVLLMV